MATPVKTTITLKFPLVITFTLLGLITSAQPHPLVQAIFADNQPLRFNGDTINLQSSEQLVIVFSNLAEGNHLLYQLNGNSDTLKINNPPVAIFSKLKEGTYNFNSTLVSQDGQTAEAPPITIHVQGSFMSRWWFIPLLIFYLLLLFGGAVYFIMLSNFRNKEKLSELRNDWTNKLHNDIGGDLSSVALRLQTLKRKLEPLDPKVKDGVVKTYKILENIQNRLRFVFDLVDPKKDSLQVMLLDVKSFAEENFALQNIQFEYRNELPTDLETKMDIGRTNKLYLAMKEVINNSFKSSEASLASLRIKHTKEGILVEIEDNGKGFDTNIPSKGNGLNNLTQYSQEGFLDINIDSEVGKGTKATILVPDI